MKFAPRYELMFALDTQTSDSLVASTSQSMATNLSIESICDRYYESSDNKVRASTKSARRQYRVRRIDHAWDVCLQSLSWDQNMCSLRQTAVPSSELANLQSDVIDKSWGGKWFHKKLVKHNLIPSLETHFDRTTWKCDSLDGEICLTVDRGIQAGSIQSQYSLQPTSNSFIPVASNIVRMNFSVSLPSIFKALIYEFALLPEQSPALLELAKAQVIEAQAIGDQAIGDQAIGDQAISAQIIRNNQAFVAPAALASNQEVATCQLG